MSTFPIIPIWLMTIISVLLIIYIVIKSQQRINLIIIIILLFIINLRIMTPSDNAKILSNNLDVLFVIDNTISMSAEDYNGSHTRLSAVQNDCKYIINELLGARFSIITFSNKARVATPFTKDNNITNEAIEILEPPNELYAKGSSLNTPIETILDSLKSASEKKDRIRVLFFISDGEITDESTLEDYSTIKDYVYNGAVLGYGTTKGGYMKSNNEWMEDEDYIMDYEGFNYGKAVSKIDENNLKKIASDLNIDYIHMDKQKNINSKIKEIKNLIENDIESSDKTSYDDTYYFLIIPLFICLMIEFNKYRRNRI